MPGAAALRFNLTRDAAAVREIGGEDVDAGHIAAKVTAYPPRRWISAATNISPARATCWVFIRAPMLMLDRTEYGSSHGAGPAARSCRSPSAASWSAALRQPELLILAGQALQLAQAVSG
jgi:hypothetical protein